MFLVEQLQPDWLSTRSQRWCYLIASRVIQAAIFTLLLVSALDVAAESFELLNPLKIAAASALLALAPAMAEGVTKAMNREAKGRFGFFLWSFCGIVAYIAYFPVDDGGIRLFAPIVVTLIVLRGARSLGAEIRTSEQLSWSWKNFARGFLLLVFLPGRQHGPLWMWLCRVVLLAYATAATALFLTAIFVPEGSGFIAPLLTPSLLCGVIYGTSARVVSLKARPNMGIALSLRASGIILAIGFAMTGLALVAKHFGKLPSVSLYMGGTLENPVPWLLAIVTVCAAAWFGGMDVIAHYCLRLILCLFGYGPRNLVRFLDYAATELGFLQKVGGGYTFMHRYLLEYFAEQDALELRTLP